MLAIMKLMLTHVGLMHASLQRRNGRSHNVIFLSKGNVLQGLQKPRKELPSKYFYNERGARLFEQICLLDEYYITRTELHIMQERVQEMASLLGPNCLLIEYGSGSSAKIRMLLDALETP